MFKIKFPKYITLIFLWLDLIKIFEKNLLTTAIWKSKLTFCFFWRSKKKKKYFDCTHQPAKQAYNSTAYGSKTSFVCNIPSYHHKVPERRKSLIRMQPESNPGPLAPSIAPRPLGLKWSVAYRPVLRKPRLRSNFALESKVTQIFSI